MPSPSLPFFSPPPPFPPFFCQHRDGGFGGMGSFSSFPGAPFFFFSRMKGEKERRIFLDLLFFLSPSSNLLLVKRKKREAELPFVFFLFRSGFFFSFPSFLFLSSRGRKEEGLLFFPFSPLAGSTVRCGPFFLFFLMKNDWLSSAFVGRDQKGGEGLRRSPLLCSVFWEGCLF